MVHLDRSLTTDAAPRVGFIVGRAVGGSVVRHRVARRLRAQMSTRLGSLPAGSGVVVRALPAAAETPSTDLGSELESALRRVLDKSAR